MLGVLTSLFVVCSSVECDTLVKHAVCFEGVYSICYWRCDIPINLFPKPLNTAIDLCAEYTHRMIQGAHAHKIVRTGLLHHFLCPIEESELWR